MYFLRAHVSVINKIKPHAKMNLQSCIKTLTIKPLYLQLKFEFITTLFNAMFSHGKMRATPTTGNDCFTFSTDI